MSPLRELISVSTEPMGLLAWGMLLALWASRRQATTPAWRCWCGLTVLYFAAGSPFVANGLLHGWERQATRTCPPPPAGSILLVLAGGIDGLPGDEDTFERLKDASFRRTVAAIRLAKASPGTTLLFSGGSGEEVREADVMGRLALEMGVSPERILTERASRNTFDNARQSKALLQAKGLTGPTYLITSALHMPRARATFASAGWRLCEYPVDYRTIHVDRLAALVPQASALNKLTEVVHELLGYFAYKATGKI